MTFDEAFDRLVGNEGGYVNNPSDPGRETKFGIGKSLGWAILPRVQVQAGVRPNDG